MFALLAASLVGIASRISSHPIHVMRSLLFVPAAMLMVFGWTYPHFLERNPWTAYLYAAPMGLLPCPTLATVIGATVMLSFVGLDAMDRHCRYRRSRVWGHRGVGASGEPRLRPVGWRTDGSWSVGAPGSNWNGAHDQRRAFPETSRRLWENLARGEGSFRATFRGYTAVGDLWIKRRRRP
jgi:hypothetical protein